MPVTVDYNNKKYSTLISFNDGCLTMVVEETPDSFGKLKFTSDSKMSTVDYETLVKEFNTKFLPDEYLPKIIFDFFNFNGDIIVNRAINDEKNKYYSKHSVGNHTIIFVVKKNENGEFYNLFVK